MMMRSFWLNTMYNIRVQKHGDKAEVSRLMGLGFSEAHQKRNIWTLREGRPIASLCLVAEDNERQGHLLGSIRFWAITVAALPSILLGPLAVDPLLRGQGIGAGLIREALKRANSEKWHYCFISGEPDYYPKFGFQKLTASSVDLPAPIEEERLHIMPLSGNILKNLPQKPWAIRPLKKSDAAKH